MKSRADNQHSVETRLKENITQDEKITEAVKQISIESSATGFYSALQLLLNEINDGSVTTLDEVKQYCEFQLNNKKQALEYAKTGKVVSDETKLNDN